MFYSLDLFLKAETKEILDQAISNLPPSTDSAVWEVQYDLASAFFSEIENSWVALAMVRFYQEPDRDSYFDLVSNLQGVLDTCLPGSYLRKHLCFNKEEMPCEVEIIYEVV